MSLQTGRITVTLSGTTSSSKYGGQVTLVMSSPNAAACAPLAATNDVTLYPFKMSTGNAVATMTKVASNDNSSVNVALALSVMSGEWTRTNWACYLRFYSPVTMTAARC